VQYSFGRGTSSLPARAQVQAAENIFPLEKVGIMNISSLRPIASCLNQGSCDTRRAHVGNKNVNICWSAKPEGKKEAAWETMAK
jgi:hypothetical protein